MIVCIRGNACEHSSEPRALYWAYKCPLARPPARPPARPTDQPTARPPAHPPARPTNRPPTRLPTSARRCAIACGRSAKDAWKLSASSRCSVAFVFALTVKLCSLLILSTASSPKISPAHVSAGQMCCVNDAYAHIVPLAVRTGYYLWHQMSYLWYKVEALVVKILG